MNYKIITDEVALKLFIEWLPELKPNETFYGCLFARSKYCKGIAHIKSDKAQLKRFTSDKGRLFNKIQQLETPLGTYLAKGVGTGMVAAPQESLALYITANPRDLEAATRSSIQKLQLLSWQPYNGYNPNSEVLSEIQKSKSRTVYVTFDFDLANKERIGAIIRKVNGVINSTAYRILETRGGYHLLVEPSKVDKSYASMWYQNMQAILAYYSSDRDNIGDIMMPVPGTYQGGFTPKLFV